MYKGAYPHINMHVIKGDVANSFLSSGLFVLNRSSDRKKKENTQVVIVSASNYVENLAKSSKSLNGEGWP